MDGYYDDASIWRGEGLKGWGLKGQSGFKVIGMQVGLKER